MVSETLITWPNRPHWMPLLTPYALRRAANILRTQMASGRARQRRISQSVPTTMTAEWIMPSSSRNDFIGFIDYALSGGVVSFVMPVKVGGQMIDHQCRFITHPAEDEKPDGRNTRFKAEIEIRNLYKSPAEQVVADVLAPGTLEEFVNDSGMNQYYNES